MTQSIEGRPLMRIREHRYGFMTALVAAGIWLAGSGTASAQYGFGLGFGDMMFGGMRTVPSPTDFLNQHALSAAARGMQGPTQNRAYGPGSNSFHNNVRDNGFVSSGNVARRRSPSASTSVARSQSNRSLGNTTQAKPAAPAPAPKPVPALASFFDAALRLAWPSESPTTGDLGEKKEISDRASLGVLQESRRYQIATLASVTGARQKLLDYGRPALQEIRASSTAPIADAFHQFMLSLYESLAQAAVNP